MSNRNWDRAKKAGKYGSASAGLIFNVASAPTPKPLSQQQKDWYSTSSQSEQRRRSNEISRSTRRKNQPTISEVLWGKQPKKRKGSWF